MKISKLPRKFRKEMGTSMFPDVGKLRKKINRKYDVFDQKIPENPKFKMVYEVSNLNKWKIFQIYKKSQRPRLITAHKFSTN